MRISWLNVERLGGLDLQSRVDFGIRRNPFPSAGDEEAGQKLARSWQMTVKATKVKKPRLRRLVTDKAHNVCFVVKKKGCVGIR